MRGILLLLCVLATAAPAEAGTIVVMTDRPAELGRVVDAARKSAAWFVVEGDAARGLGRARDAATAFETAARMLPVGSAERVEAAYSAAYLRFRTGDAAQGLVVMDVHGVDASGSALEERGLGLRVQMLVASGRKETAADVARRYLARFPRGGLRAYMQRQASAPQR